MSKRSRDPGSRRRPLVLLRHGESTANADGLFTGGWDVRLSGGGIQQARRAARLLEVSALPDVVITSPLLRATQTVEIVLKEIGRSGLDQVVSPDLTERGYGILTGLPKTGVSEILGAEQVRRWRRSVTGRPPRLSELLGEAHAAGLRSVPAVESLLSDVPSAARAAAEISESLAEVVSRVRRCLEDVLIPNLRSGRCTLVVAHGNSLRALVSILDALDVSGIERLNIPTGEPLLYAVSDGGVPVPDSGRYLDPDSAREAALAVAREGGT